MYGIKITLMSLFCPQALPVWTAFSPHWAPLSQSQSEAKIEVSFPFPQEEKVASWWIWTALEWDYLWTTIASYTPVTACEHCSCKLTVGLLFQSGVHDCMMQKVETTMRIENPNGYRYCLHYPGVLVMPMNHLACTCNLKLKTRTGLVNRP